VIGIQVEIVRYVDDWQPGLIECYFTDANGRQWLFIEKVPVVTDAQLDAQSLYPQRGFIACEVFAAGVDGVTINTCRPWGIESTDGQTQFEVLPQSVVEW
jgi:hypothetical protein